MFVVDDWLGFAEGFLEALARVSDGTRQKNNP
jgi:hypothetical protein